MPQSPALDRDAASVTKVGYNSHRAKGQNAQSRFEINHQQLHTGGGGNSK